MEVASSAISLVDASLNLLSKLKESYEEHGKDKISNGVRSIQRDLEYIKEALRKGSETAEQQGTLSWMNDIRCIKLRIEDVMELYDLEFTGQTGGHFEGIGARVVEKLVDKGKRVVGPGRKIRSYLKEIEDLSARAKKRADEFHFHQISRGQPPCQTTRNEEKDFYHDNEAEPVGLDAPRKELVRMLSMSSATLLRVVAIESPDSELARAAFENVQSKEEFTCKAWVTASSNDDDGKRLLKDMIDGLGQKRQRKRIVKDIIDRLGQQGQRRKFMQLAKILRGFLENKRYIIGIDNLETTRYWNDLLLSAFPDDNMSSRIIVTTRKDKIADTCHKNCPVYRMRPALDTKPPEAELVQILCEGTARKRRVVTVFGPGGSGKSILARAAYEQLTEKEHFQHKAWAMASHNKGKGLLLDILRQLGKTNVGEENISQLIDILRGLLLNGRYIIVIDGLETTCYWNNVLSACPDNNKSNRIIVTTASNRVTNICQRNGPVYKIQPLDKNSAKHLLEKKVMFPCNVDRDRLMTMILETCEYLPLAIANMGDYMRSLNKTWDYVECEKACTDIGSLLVNNEKEAFRGMKHVVNRSYTSLNDNAKACLLSLNIYFKNLVIENHVINDHLIEGKPLIRRLLAERLISSSSPSSSVDGLANECFTELIEQNFIVPVEISSSGQVKRFRVNRMMPLFIHGKGHHENYVTRIDIRPGQDVERLSADITRLYLKNSSSEPPRIGRKASTTHVRLLTYHGEASKVLMDFKNYMFLRVLILENCENMKNEHLLTVCSRPVLRYLSIRGNQDVTMLPANIVNMRSLETLDTRDTKVHKIPMDVILLPVLQHLFGKFQIILKNKIMFPKNSKVQKVAKFIPNENPLSNLFEGKENFPIESSRLQTLAGFLVDEVPPYFVTLWPRMPMLSKVRILCGQTAPNETVTKDLLKSLKSCLKKEVQDGNSPLYSMTIDFHGRSLNFLDNLEIEPPCLLRSLKLCGKLTRLPQFILSLSDCLEELCLSETNLGCRALLELRHLKKLQFLKLTGDFFEFEQLTFEPYWFCSLQRLCFDVPKVPKIVLKEHAMEGLESLQLVCNELGGVSGILNLKRLKEVMLSTRVSGAAADDLLKQVSKHSMKPKLLYADGSSQHMLLSRRGRLQ